MTFSVANDDALLGNSYFKMGGRVNWDWSLDSLDLPLNFNCVSQPADDLYINSVENMQNEIKDGLTVENFEYLPLWMKSPQDDKLVPGFKLALPIQYVKAGRGAEILYKIKNQSSYDLKSSHQPSLLFHYLKECL